MTCRRVGALLHETGMVSAEKMHSVLEGLAAHADDEMTPAEAAGALVEFGTAVSVHVDDIDSIYEDYAPLLARAAEVAGGRVTIAGVRIVKGEGGFEGGRCDLLEFERDGTLVSLVAEHFSEDYYDHETAYLAIRETAHADDPRSWRNVDFAREPGSVHDNVIVLATPAQGEALHEHLGLTLF
ncbi:hypothetical protein ABZS61_18850 [Streptomyces sp. NPDC005566]|uniref:hypothetical protein n=1 Tax=Streptomyces sp. NPDC005566 TaxID=3156886 RepID=UPI0033A37EB4